MAIFVIIKMTFFAILNLVDFVTDILVLLRLSCRLEPDSGQSCVESGPTTCKPHPWWTGIGCLILVVSTFYCAIKWMAHEDQKWSMTHRTQRTCKGRARRTGLWLISLMQLSPFVDILDAVRNGVDPVKKKTGIERDLLCKKLESGPQALLQSYIMFSLGSQREVLNVFSVFVSVFSLSLGLVDYYMQPADDGAGEQKAESGEGADVADSSVPSEVVGAKQDDTASGGDAETGPVQDSLESSPVIEVVDDAPDGNAGSQKLLRSSTFIPEPDIGRPRMDRPDSPVKKLYTGKLAAFIYLGCDTTLRCIAYAVNFSPAVRGPGLALASICFCIFVLQHPELWVLIAARHEYYKWFTQSVTRIHRRKDREALEANQREAGPSSEASTPFLHKCIRGLLTCVLVAPCALLYVGVMLIILSVSVALPATYILLYSLTACSEVVQDCARPSSMRLASLRFLEYLCHGVLIATMAQTACKEPATLETRIFFTLFGITLLSYMAYIVMQLNLPKLEKCEETLKGKVEEITSSCLTFLGLMAARAKECLCCCCKTKQLDTE